MAGGLTFGAARTRNLDRLSAQLELAGRGTALETQRLQKILSARVPEQKDVGQLGLLECDDGREAIRRSVVALPASSPISTSRPYKRDVRKDLRPPAPASTPYPWPPGIHKNVGDLVMLTSHGVCAKAPMVTPRVGDRVRLNPDSRQCSNSTALQGTLMHVKASGAFRFQAGRAARAVGTIMAIRKDEVSVAWDLADGPLYLVDHYSCGRFGLFDLVYA